MLKTAMNRRTYLKLTASTAAGLLSAGGHGTSASAAETRLRMIWWGSQDRARRTIAVGELFSETRPDVKFEGETLSADYWTKLATRMAGRGMPDIITLEPNTFGDYCRRGAAVPLDDLMPPLDFSASDSGLHKLCMVDGKTFGGGIGLNSLSIFYDTDALQKVGAKPSGDMTWADFADLSVEVTKAAGRQGYWGAGYGARYNYVFDVWLRQRGKMLYNGEGTLGFNVEDAKEWYTYWEQLRQRGGAVPADVSTLDTSQIDTNALTLGKAAMGFTFSNQLEGYQLMIKPKLAISMLPAAGKETPSGHYYRCSQYLCVSANCKQPKLATELINFFMNDIRAGKVLGVERGVPFSPAVRAAVTPDLNEVGRATVDYINLLADKVVEPPLPLPKGTQEVDRRVMRPVADQLAFGRMTVDEAARTLLQEGERLLSRRRE